MKITKKHIEYVENNIPKELRKEIYKIIKLYDFDCEDDIVDFTSDVCGTLEENGFEDGWGPAEYLAYEC